MRRVSVGTVPVLALLLVLPLAGCATAAPPPPILSSATVVTQHRTTAPTPNPSASVGRSSGTGCRPTAATTPARAFTARIADVDGDGRPDREWALIDNGTLRFGFTTASGATIGASQGFAGGGERSFVTGRLSNGITIAITSEGRDSPLWSLVHCVLRPVKGTYTPHDGFDDQFVFYSVEDAGAAGCLHGGLVGFHTISAGKDRETVTAEHVTVSSSGLHARTGRTTVVMRNADYRTVRRYQGISCGASPVLRPTVHR